MPVPLAFGITLLCQIVINKAVFGDILSDLLHSFIFGALVLQVAYQFAPKNKLFAATLISSVYALICIINHIWHIQVQGFKLHYLMCIGAILGMVAMHMCHRILMKTENK